MTTCESRPGVGPRTAQVASLAAPTIHAEDDTPRARCTYCHKPLRRAESIRHEAGPVCWARAVTAQAEAVRAAAVADLEAVADIVRAAPVPVLAAVRAALADLTKALGELDAAGVTP